MMRPAPRRDYAKHKGFHHGSRRHEPEISAPLSEHPADQQADSGEELDAIQSRE